MEAIVAIDCKNGIGKNGNMPWHIKEDLQFFKNITLNNVVIMGKNTFFSLSPNVKNSTPKPLKDRLNVVLTSEPEKYVHYCENHRNLVFTSNEHIFEDLQKSRDYILKCYKFLKPDFKIFIIGGETLYTKFAPLCNTIWVTHIENDYDCNKFFNVDIYNNFKSFIINSNEEFTIKKYVRTIQSQQSQEVSC
jgi:dihydrofolate reductase|uniref:dihydrofolate reductase n=1 Tax=viral metagenome TaxID=1070528 RepID=A0A6C0HCW1_9ZZZZ